MGPNPDRAPTRPGPLKGEATISLHIGPGPGWGPVRVGAQSGLGPGPGWGPDGPIWALMLFFKSVTFRVQTAPFDKITIDFCRSRRRLHDSDLPGAKKHKIGPKFKT